MGHLRADEFLEEAKSEAEKIIFNAEALGMLWQYSEKEAEAYQERSIKAVHQSARDLLIHRSARKSDRKEPASRYKR